MSLSRIMNHDTQPKTMTLFPTNFKGKHNGFIIVDEEANTVHVL